MDKALVANEDAFLLSTPMHRQLSGTTAWCIEQAHQSGLPFLWKPHPGDALIGRARSIVATWFLQKVPYPYLVFLDSDIVFRPESLKKLHDDMKQGYDLIGGVYTVRSAKQLAHYKRTSISLANDIVEVDYLSTGFTGISKRLLQRMVDELEMPLCHEHEQPFTCYPFFENTAQLFDGKWIYESEDWDFCRKARKVGAVPMLDTSIRLGHEGSKVWTVEDMPPETLRKLPSKLVLPDNKANAVRAPRLSFAK